MRVAGVLVVLCITLKTHALSSPSFPIGGLFNGQTHPDSELAFQNIVKMRSAYHGAAIHPEVIDGYSTSLEVCKNTSQTDGGVIALVDARPTFGYCDNTCLLCNRLNVCHLSVGWEMPGTLAQDEFTFAYHPPPELISKAYATLIKNLQWDKFTVLYENDDSLIRIQEIINTWPYNNEPIVYRKLNPDGDNRETFKYIFKIARMSYHVLDCEAKNIRKYIDQIIQVENSTQYQSFILTALDAYMENLDDANDFMANVSTLHLTTANDVKWQDINIPGTRISIETALTADALNHLETAIRTMNSEEQGQAFLKGTQEGSIEDQPPALCIAAAAQDYSSIAWPLGRNLRDALLKTTSKGFTGNIEFDANRKRTNFIMHYSKLNTESQFVYAGSWDSTTDLITDTQVVSERSFAKKSNSLVKIVSRKGEPYFFIDEANETATFSGYAVDLVEAIFEKINSKPGVKLNYEFYRVHKDSYGQQIEGTKKWDGLIGELQDHNADMAVCDITITSERNTVVDFSTPFMTLGISMLFREPDPVPASMFAFIEPLSLDVWLYLCTTYIIVSFILLICARMSQGDWVNPHPCNQNPENLQNIWNLYNCMWLTMGAIMTQGCDILPRAAGSRWVTGMWWFFALIITSSYTANMSTFISNSRRTNEITDVTALSEQNAVSYGAVYNASTYRFFQNSNETVYAKIWAVMNSAKPTVFTNTNEEGRDRVLRSKGKYAFFMESTAIEYYKQRNCDLKIVGQKLDSKEYGIAMPKNSPFKGLVDNAILSLQESGQLEILKNKWWNGNLVCSAESEADDNGSLQMKNTSGIFLVLASGGFIGLIMAIIDFLMHANKIAVKEKVSFKEALKSEWRASFNPRALSKPAAPARSAAPSTRSASRERSRSRAVSVLQAATSFINFDEIY